MPKIDQVIDLAVHTHGADMERRAAEGAITHGRGILLYALGPDAEVNAVYIPAEHWHADPVPDFADDPWIEATIDTYPLAREFMALIVVADRDGENANAQVRTLGYNHPPAISA